MGFLLYTDLTPPSLNLTNIDQSDDEESSVYDEDGDHNLMIPQEFRNLSIQNFGNSSFDIEVTTLYEFEDDDAEISVGNGKDNLLFDFNNASVANVSLKTSPLDFYDQTSLEIEDTKDEDNEYENDEEIKEEKHFDFSVHPNDIRLSDEACVHLLNLVEYQSDCEGMSDWLTVEKDVFNFIISMIVTKIIVNTSF